MQRSAYRVHRPHARSFDFFLEPLAILQKFVYNNRWNDSSALISAVIQWNNSSDKRFFPAYLERKMRAVQDER